jgi:hypothetical protein|tara:strand:- start:303 stop:404 length:102 start_codon:yes stop_codon:yes gene_type:complete
MLKKIRKSEKKGEKKRRKFKKGAFCRKVKPEFF